MIAAINIENFLDATNSKFMSSVLAEHLPHHLSSILDMRELWIPRVIPRGKCGFAIQYNMKSSDINYQSGNRFTLYGHLLGPDEDYPDYASIENKAVKLANPRMVIPLFPYDPELANLGDLFSENYYSQIAERLKEGFPKPDSSRAISIRMLAYRLGRRCTISYGRNDGNTELPQRIIAKAVKGAAQSDQWQNLPNLEQAGFSRGSEDRLTVPHLLGIDEKHDTYFMEFVDGISLHDLIGKSEFIDGCRAAGRILKKLHLCQLKVMHAYTYRDEIRGLIAKFMVAGELFPQLMNGFSRAIEELERHSGNVDGAPSALIHRDFYDKQVLYATDRVTLLDCDGATMGDPALDYGNFMAHLTLRMRQTPEHAALIEAARQGFAESYGANDDEFLARACWWKSSALTRLASLYSLRPRWRRLTPALLADVINTINGDKQYGRTE
jgi:hypothetical protein